MAQNLDDDDIVSVQGPDEEEDDIVEVAPVPSMLQSVSDNAMSAASPIREALQTAQDFSVGTARGLTMNALDEIGGLIGAGVETGLGKLGFGPGAVDEQLKAQGFDVPEQSFLEKYRDYQQASEQAQKEAAERSPVAEILGQIGGGVTGGIALGGLLGVGKAAKGAQAISDIAKNQGKAKAAMELLRRGGSSYAKAAPLIAAESALTSEEQLLGEQANPVGVAADVAGGLAFGLPAVIGLEAATQGVVPSIRGKLDKVGGKIKDVFEDEGNPRLRQMARAYQYYGKDIGIHPRSHAEDIGGMKFSQRDSNIANMLTDVMGNADKKLGQEVGQSIEKATQRGAIIDVSPDIQAAAQRVAGLAQQLPDLGSSRKSQLAFEKILKGEPQLSPTEVKNLIDDLDAAIGTFKAATNKDAAAVGTLNELVRHRKAISDTFKKSVPEYAEAAQRFESFRNVLEQLVSGARPDEITGVFYGSLRNQDQKVFDKLLKMIEDTQSPINSTKDSRQSFSRFMDALEEFEAKELARPGVRVGKVLPDVRQIRKTILEASDDSVLRGSVRQTTESRSVLPDLREAAIGKAPTSGAYLAGRAMKSVENIGKKPVVQKTAAITKAIYNAPAQAVSNLASKLEASGNFSQVGKALRESLENGDTAKKNAALFTIMQNPNARAFISAEDFPDSENVEE